MRLRFQDPVLALRLLLALCVLLPLLALAGLGALRWQQLQQESRARVQRTLGVAHEHALKVLETNELMLERVLDLARGTDDALRANEAALHAQLRHLSEGKPQIQSIWILGADGHPVANNRFLPVPRLDISDREFFRWHRDGPGGLYMTEPLIARATGEPFFDLSRTRRAPDGSFGGLVTVGLYPAYFAAFQQQLLAEDPGMSLIMFRADGQIYARTPAVQGVRRLDAASRVMREIQAGHTSGSFEAVSPVDGAVRRAYFQQIGHFPAYVAASLDMGSLWRTWGAELARYAAFDAAATAGLVLLALLAMRRTRESLEATQRLHEQTVAREAAEQRLGVERELRESEERFRLLAAAANDAFWELDLADGTVWWNEAYDQLFGPRPRSSARSSQWWVERLHPEDRERVTRSLQACIEGPDDRWSIEYRFRRGDGSHAYVLDRGLVSRDASGTAVRMAGSMVDLTRLKEAETALREADRRKDEFLATLAHELRNPLAPIRTAVNVLERTGSSDPRERRMRQMIDRQVSHMVRLVDDLLDLSRISRGTIEMRHAPVDLAEVVQLAVETSEPIVERAAQHLHVIRPDAPLRMQGDAVRLVQAIANLINNASKYTPEGGSIVLRLAAADGRATISVEDGGIGIPADMLERIFDMFAQVPAHRDRAQGGLGIGLTLVRAIVTQHGGTVRAYSDGPGLGSRFVIELPLLKDTQPRASPDEPAGSQPEIAGDIASADSYRNS